MESIVTYGSRDFELDLSRYLVFGHPASHMIAQMAAHPSHFGITWQQNLRKSAAKSSHLCLQEVA
jgi:hypothetical protein